MAAYPSLCADLALFDCLAATLRKEEVEALVKVRPAQASPGAAGLDDRVASWIKVSRMCQYVLMS